MSFVSYAQNFEDVMLWRALKHIEKGFYVDVGAQDPLIDSVSKAFYERGWRGIHIEPVPQYAELLRKDRPDETVLQIALADCEGTLELNIIPDTGISTFVDAYAQRHKVERGYEHQRIQVPVLTLKSTLRFLSGKDVHWLKIDVEGFEEKVLKGWDSQTLRPWIIVVEATIPLSPDTDCASWDPIFTAAEYQFVYFDGLNRFYVSKEHAELAGAFSCPPNFFDDVVLAENSYLCRGVVASHQEREKELVIRAENLTAELHAANEHTARLQAQLQRLQNEWDAAKAKIDELNQSSHHWWTVADHLNRELQGVYASKSWRITWPLRKTMQAIKWVLALSMPTMQWALSLPKRAAQTLMLWAMRRTLSNPRLKAGALHVLAKCPRLKQQLREFATRSSLVPGWGMASPSSRQFESDSSLPEIRDKPMNSLSRRAARIYADLRRATDASKR